MIAQTTGELTSVYKDASLRLSLIEGLTSKDPKLSAIWYSGCPCKARVDTCTLRAWTEILISYVPTATTQSTQGSLI